MISKMYYFCLFPSGGGLVMLDSEYKRRFYLQGIPSAGITKKSGECDGSHYVVFTQVSKYTKWIERQFAYLGSIK